ncbi:hypothetical protein BAV2353 [Bordetella avium 197N]|uniref:Uncharacterized protein n=1 Tax=Bordetella avium (strain 197N) TaxID=360910 RepID=Q2KY77_BORA1|nr:hypothetical protein BAV2353 [Bordetella avium 197N]
MFCRRDRLQCALAQRMLSWCNLGSDTGTDTEPDTGNRKDSKT